MSGESTRTSVLSRATHTDPRRSYLRQRRAITLVTALAFILSCLAGGGLRLVAMR